MRELIDVLQTNAPTSQFQAPASLLRMLVHVVNIQKSVDQGSDDPANAIKRLRDFANTIERLDLGDENHDGREGHSGPADRSPAAGRGPAR